MTTALRSISAIVVGSAIGLILADLVLLLLKIL